MSTIIADAPLSIVRIKRKLHASTNGSSPNAGHAMPMVERAGPEALMLAEPSRKRTRMSSSPAAAPNPLQDQRFFAFAETVPVSSFESPDLTSALRERLKSLASATPAAPPSEAGPSHYHQKASGITSPPRQDLGASQRGKYKVIGKTRGEEFDLVDVDLDTGSNARKRRRAGNTRTRQSEQLEAQEQEKMEQFNDLLREYLSFDAAKPFASTQPEHGQSTTVPSSRHGAAADVDEQEESDSDGDYVYDIYYKTAPTAQAYIPDSYAEVTGLDVSDLENMSSDSDVQDGEVDPDSNDEGFYANDYPDEEDMGGLSEDISSDPESDSADESDDWER